MGRSPSERPRVSDPSHFLFSLLESDGDSDPTCHGHNPWPPPPPLLLLLSALPSLLSDGDSGVDFVTVDVLDEEHNNGLRESLKTYSNWPAFPQVLVGGELVGGCDIASSMAEKGELAERRLMRLHSPADVIYLVISERILGVGLYLYFVIASDLVHQQVVA